ncbi:Retrovirus-related Pol polyprotein from transposon [Sesamum angolense]|uniref:Retrovirus-related Pol polyprotein from transposon n=1 Tax=Sesamum angolense TaxID=2727404 RepID=A0AAE1VZA2_9LAMI|nr:Retrovirus-related Pol polyprotein from transposon [Sesamum angolense]
MLAESKRHCAVHEIRDRQRQECQNSQSWIPGQNIPGPSMTGKAKVVDPPRKGVIRMIGSGLSVETHKGLGRPSSVDILFGEAYDQMQLGGAPLEAVDTSLYGFVGARKCYVEAIKRGKKRRTEEPPETKDSNKRGKDPVPSPEPDKEASSRVQPVEELLTIELTLGNPGKVTKIGSKITENVRNQVINCLRKNKDIFACTPQDLEGIDLGVIMHHLNLNPGVKPVKQKKRHFGPEKDKIIQREVNKLLSVGHIKEIQFPKWLSNVVLVPKPGGKWRMCIDFWDLNKACPKDFYPLPRIDQLVDSISGCKLLSMMDATQGYHQIMLAPEDHKRVSFIISNRMFCYVAIPFAEKCRSHLSKAGG